MRSQGRRACGCLSFPKCLGQAIAVLPELSSEVSLSPSPAKPLCGSSEDGATQTETKDSGIVRSSREKQPLAVIFVNVPNEVASDLCSAAWSNSGSFVSVPSKKSRGRTSPFEGLLAFPPPMINAPLISEMEWEDEVCYPSPCSADRGGYVEGCRGRGGGFVFPAREGTEGSLRGCFRCAESRRTCLRDAAKLLASNYTLQLCL